MLYYYGDDVVKISSARVQYDERRIMRRDVSVADEIKHVVWEHKNEVL